ncbi:Uncharacterised protein [Rodentibacter pneumotropicus]|uniref:Uncharacterized protein n=1 Tax=Rodentibacter pneumotropicus TaxID=758 RepID=A0A448MQP8_9PAST|nr:Uncharacterised protein [Rodentibacter pneumotropicus]
MSENIFMRMIVLFDLPVTTKAKCEQQINSANFYLRMDIKCYNYLFTQEL